MKVKSLMTILVVAVFMTSTAAAQTIGIGTTPPGSYTHSAGSAIAKVLSEKTGLKVRVQPQGSTTSLAIHKGDVHFGMSNSFDGIFFRNGTGDYKGKKPGTNLRVAMVLTPLRVAVFVRKDSPYKTIKDLKGKRVSSGFTSQKTIGRIVKAHLINAGLSYKDVKKVPAPNVARAADDFMAGKVDMLFFALGSAKVMQASAKVGGIRALNIDSSPEAIARMRELLPGAFAMTVKPSKRLHGIEGPTDIIAFNLNLNSSIEVPNDIVYQVVKTLHGNKKGLLSSFRGLALFSPDRMAQKYEGIEYHPGAIKFYKEIGQWPPK